MALEEFWWSSNGGGPDPGDLIGQSLRFRGAQRLNRTPATAGNINTWTWSCWVKKARWDIAQPIFCAKSVSDTDAVTSWSPEIDQFGFVWRDTLVGTVQVAGKQRDPSAWYHLVYRWDVNEPVATRMRIYINGELQTLSTNNPPALEMTINSTAPHAIGVNRAGGTAPTQNFEGYMADMYMVDGQSLDPTAFGRENDEGVWVPREPDFTPAEMRPSDYLFSMPWSATPDTAEFLTTTQRSFNASQPASLAFDGLIGGSNFAQANGGMVWRPETQPEGVTRIVVRGRRISNAWLNGTKLSFSSVDNADFDIYNGPAVDLTTLAIFSGSSSFPSDLERIQLEQDGVLTTVLNPYMWSADLTASGSTFSAAGQPQNAFNGQTGTTQAAELTGNGAIIWDPTPNIVARTSIRVFTPNANCFCEVNNLGSVALTQNGWTEVSNGTAFPIEIETINVARSAPAGSPPAVSAYEIDGRIYIDAINNSYGVNGYHLDFSDPDDLGADRSGNGNDWTPTGFDTAPVGIFSQFMTGPNGFAAGQGAANAFVDPNSQNPNGTFARSANNGDTITFAPPGGIPYTNGYQIKAAFCDLRVNGVQKQTMTSGNAIYFEAGSGTIETVEFVGSSSRPEINYFLINPGSEQSSSPNPPPAGFYLADNTGVDYDLMQDSPTQNWATLNSLNIAGTYSEANLNVQLNSDASNRTTAATHAALPTSGKY